MCINKNKAKALTDILLSSLVFLGAVSAVWLGLSGTRYVPVSTVPAEKAEHYESIPEGAFAVVIDPGHGGFDGGAVGTETGIAEAELNLIVARSVRQKLEESGIYVIMTRNGSDAIGETKAADMTERKRIMQLDGVDLVLSIHMNKFGDRSVSGPMVFYMKGSEEGKKLADSVIACVCESIGRPPRSANPEDLFVLRVPKAPSVLVECGFLSNRADEVKLISEEYQEHLAQGIADGICSYKALAENGDSE